MLIVVVVVVVVAIGLALVALRADLYDENGNVRIRMAATARKLCGDSDGYPMNINKRGGSSCY